MTAQDDLKAALDEDEAVADQILALITKLQNAQGEVITPELIAEAKDIGAKLSPAVTPPVV